MYEKFFDAWTLGIFWSLVKTKVNESVSLLEQMTSGKSTEANDMLEDLHHQNVNLLGGCIYNRSSKSFEFNISNLIIFITSARTTTLLWSDMIANLQWDWEYVIHVCVIFNHDFINLFEAVLWLSWFQIQQDESLCCFCCPLSYFVQGEITGCFSLFFS